MKKMIFRGFAGLAMALALAFVISPVNAKAAGEPLVSLVTDYFNVDGATYVLISNKGSLGSAINACSWSISEHAVNLSSGQITLDYAENRVGLQDPIYINTSKFTDHSSNLVTIKAVCPQLNFSYTATLTIKADKLVDGEFHIITSGSNCLYNGAVNPTIDGFPMPLGLAAKASVQAMLPPGYVAALEGSLIFNYAGDYVNKSGVVCYNIPDGYRDANRTYKLATVGEGGAITFCDDLDINPATISANVNFNGYGVVLCYAESAPAANTIPAVNSVTIPSTTPAYTTNANGTPQNLTPMLGYKFEKQTQGPSCQAIFKAFTPAGYTLVNEYALYTNGSANFLFKNGVVVINVPTTYSDYKLITVDSNGGVMILDDLDANPATGSYAVNFAGYACALVAR